MIKRKKRKKMAVSLNFKYKVTSELLTSIWQRISFKFPLKQFNKYLQCSKAPWSHVWTLHNEFMVRLSVNTDVDNELVRNMFCLGAGRRMKTQTTAYFSCVDDVCSCKQQAAEIYSAGITACLWQSGRCGRNFRDWGCVELLLNVSIRIISRK